MAMFFKHQTKFTWVPALINCRVQPRGTTVQVGIRSGYSQDPEHPCPDCREPDHAEIELTANEALALAAWLQGEADKINRRSRAATERKAKRAAKRAAGGRNERAAD